MNRVKVSSMILFLFFMFCFHGCASHELGAVSHQTIAATCVEPNKAVGQYYQTIKNAPPDIAEAIRRFPKGADIHSHLSGAIMPEDYISMGIADGDCYGSDPKVPYMDTITANAGAPDACKNKTDTPLYKATDADKNKITQSLSMSGFNYTDIQSGHDQFFATFGRFGAVSGSNGNRGKMLAKLLRQANADTVSYVEMMTSFQSPAVGTLADALRQAYPPDRYDYTDKKNYESMYSFLRSHGLDTAAAAAGKDISDYSSIASGLLKCNTPAQDPACLVSYAFLSEINRNSATAENTVDLPKIFTQTALSFHLSSVDKRVVGVNLVSGEDLPVSMNNFSTEMRFIGYFNAKYPNVNIALHAGEITPCFVRQDNPALKEHITGSLGAGAKRIGHAISFEYLSDANRTEVADLIKKKNALVELLFASNAQILGVGGAGHPFPLYYWQYGVPVSFSTDDEGVSYANYSDEWIYAFMQYNNFYYTDMIALARLSEQYSFIPGDQLWENVAAQKIATQCAGQIPGTPNPPDPCKSFLANSPKAAMQWNYEAALSSYDRDYGKIFKNTRVVRN